MTNILSKLTLTNETKKEVAVDKTALRRAKVVMNLLEPADLAKAMLDGKEYVAMRTVQDEQGNSVEKAKRVKKWFFNNGTAEWFLEVRYANKAIEIAKNKTAISVANKSKLVETIQLVANAVENCELDTAINKIAEEKKRAFAKSAQKREACSNACYYALFAEEFRLLGTKTIRIVEVENNERANALKEVKRLCKEFGFTAGMLKGCLAEGRKAKEK